MMQNVGPRRGLRRIMQLSRPSWRFEEEGE